MQSKGPFGDVISTPPPDLNGSRGGGIGINEKLALRPKALEEQEHPKDTTKVLIETRGESGPETHTEERKSQATIMAELVTRSGAELWHTPNHEAYATVTVDSHKEHHALKSGAFRRWMSALYYEKTGKVPGSQAVQDALGALSGLALFRGETHTVSVRVAGDDNEIYIDLANDEWEVVKITDQGWGIVKDPPVRFKRTRSMLPLPRPIKGGKFIELRKFVNVKSEKGFVLLLSFLVSAFRARGPYPILIIVGEQGTAKSTLARIIKSLTDPSVAPLRSAPRNGQDLMIAANSSRLLAFDNLSHIPEWLSDAFCRLSTGGGWQGRELYSDADEVVLDAQLPVVLTSIEDVVTRGDLWDRGLVQFLTPIEGSARRPESRLWQEFEEARPKLLGCLLDAVAGAIAALPNTHLETLPRMADFALWATAAETGMELASGDFMTAYKENKTEANDLALNAMPVAERVVTFAQNLTEEWIGTASALLELLGATVTESQRKAQDWPKTAQALGGQLRRLTPYLRQVGIEVDFRPRKNASKTVRGIFIRKVPENGVNSRQPVNPTLETGSAVDTSADQVDANLHPVDGMVDTSTGTVDAVDAFSQDFSNEDDWSAGLEDDDSIPF